MALDAELIEECVVHYSMSLDRLTKLQTFVVSKLEAELKERGIMARVAGRTKNVESLRAKLHKWSKDKAKSSRFEKKDHVFEVVGDLAAVRIMTYTEEDREIVFQMVKEIFASRPGKTDFEAERKEESGRVSQDRSNFYRATHMQLCLRPEHLVEPYKNLRMDHCELQITSMLAHVWNEIEHDIRYKGDGHPLSEEEILALDSLGLLTKSGDNIISSLIKANDRRRELQKQEEAKAHRTIKDATSLTKALEDHYGPSVWSKNVDYRKNADALLSAIRWLDLTTPSHLFSKLSPNALRKTIKQTIPAFRRHLKAKGLTRPAIDICSCDVFLIALISEHADRLSEMPKVNKGPRPRQIFFAEEFKEFADV